MPGSFYFSDAGGSNTYRDYSNSGTVVDLPVSPKKVGYLADTDTPLGTTQGYIFYEEGLVYIPGAIIAFTSQ